MIKGKTIMYDDYGVEIAVDYEITDNGLKATKVTANGKRFRVPQDYMEFFLEDVEESIDNDVSVEEGAEEDEELQRMKNGN